jgi:ribulose-phosphate 3-epimerase
VDQVMVMTINPGWGGQQMIPRQLEKVRRLRSLLDEAGSPADLMIDGGVTAENASTCAAAGASILVCGSSVFRPGTTPASNLAGLRAAVGRD